jgi:hypothetical protein
MITGGLTLKAGEALDRKSEKAPKALAPAPDFTLIERGGQLLTTADLHGKVWIANLIFTRCAELLRALEMFGEALLWRGAGREQQDGREEEGA